MPVVITIALQKGLHTYCGLVGLKHHTRLVVYFCTNMLEPTSKIVEVFNFGYLLSLRFVFSVEIQTCSA